MSITQNLTITSPLHHLTITLLLLFLSYQQNIVTFATGNPGNWNLLNSNTGVSAMHMQLLYTDRVLFFDLTDFGPSNISLPNNNCRDDPYDLTLKIDCTAHSVEYDIASNSIRPTTVLTNTWCSSGATVSDGTLLQTGGFNDGFRNARMYKPCNDDSCDWEEFDTVLSQGRWYASNHILPDGRQIIVGGRGQFNYEFYPKRDATDQTYDLPFLLQTNDASIENNLYPFVFLNVDGNLFIFANNRAILFDYVKGAVVKEYPSIPGGEPRNYPSAGSAVLLPLRNLQVGNNNNIIAEVLVCGGAPKGSFTSSSNGVFVEALNTCARININDPSPQWVVETMPVSRVMCDMVLLPNGNVLIINGASAGTSGWEAGRDPVLSPVIYRPSNPVGQRFETQSPSSTPRMYHSTAALLRDGRVLVGGSNPHSNYVYTGVLFPTDLTIEAFSPEYLDPKFAPLRPVITSPASGSQIGYGQQLNIDFSIEGRINRDLITVTMIRPPFTTHSFSMNQRLLVLSDGTNSKVTLHAKSSYRVRVTTPGSGILAPSGYYIVFVVYRDIPSEGIWVQIK